MGRQGARPVKVLEDGICGSLCPLPLGPRISPRRLWIGPSIGAVRSRLEVGTNLANDFSGCAEWCGSDPCSPSSVLKVIEAEDRQAAKLSDHLGKFLGQKGRDRPRGVDSGYRRSWCGPLAAGAHGRTLFPILRSCARANFRRSCRGNRSSRANVGRRRLGARGP
jgi:hypothetical protein